MLFEPCARAYSARVKPCVTHKLWYSCDSCCTCTWQAFTVFARCYLEFYFITRKWEQGTVVLLLFHAYLITSPAMIPFLVYNLHAAMQQLYSIHWLWAIYLACFTRHILHFVFRLFFVGQVHLFVCLKLLCLLLTFCLFSFLKQSQNIHTKLFHHNHGNWKRVYSQSKRALQACPSWAVQRHNW